MTILKFAGFDIFPGQANAGNTLPVHNAGLAGTPYATLFPTSISNVNHLIGVSGLPAHKMGSGAKLRNSLVTYRPAGTSTYAVFPVINGETLGNGAWTRIINFTVKDISPTDINTALSLVTLGNSMVALNCYVFGLNSSKAVMVNGTGVSGIVWELNREYSVEVRLWRVGNEAANTQNLEVRIDGTVIRTLTINPIVLTTPMYVTLGANSNTNINSARTLLYSDIIVSDGTYLGPQLVLPATVDAINSTGGWEKEGNADPVTSLSDRDDTTYFSSPADNGSLSVRLQVGEDPSVSMRGTQVFIRAARDAAAGRGLVVKAENGSGATIGGPTTISTTTNFTDYQAFNLNLSKIGDLATTAVKINAVAP